MSTYRRYASGSTAFDTGAVNFVSPSLARTLGLTVKGQYTSYGMGEKSLTSGITTMSLVRIGRLAFRDQPFHVVPLPYALSHAFRPKIVGVIGYEILSRMPVRIDYVTQTLTFYDDPSEFAHLNRRVSIPFLLYGVTPVIHGGVDGISGLFQIDTGSDSSLTLFSPFVARHDLVNTYSPRLQGFAGEGMNGPESAYFVRAHTVQISPQIFL